MDEGEIFLVVIFHILGPLGCQGWVVMAKNVKMCQCHCTLRLLSTLLDSKRDLVRSALEFEHF
jgi:hypothetical protein